MQKTTLNDPKRTPRIAFPAMVILLLGSASMPAQTGERRVSSSNTSVFTSEPCKLDPTVALTDASVSLPSDCSPPDSLQRPPNLEHAPRTLHQGDLVSFTTLAAPKNAERAYEKARRNLTGKKPRVSTAARELTTAVALYPQFAAAWYLLGETRLALRQNEAAREAFLRALGADPKYPSPYAPLALMELEVGRLREAAEFAGWAVRLNPDLIEAHYYRAVANYNLGDTTITEKSIRAIVELGGERSYPGIHLMRGQIFAAKGDFRSAEVEYRRLVQLQPSSRAAHTVLQQLADWETQGLITKPR